MKKAQRFNTRSLDDRTIRWLASERMKAVQSKAPRVAWRVAPRNVQAGIQFDLLGV